MQGRRKYMVDRFQFIMASLQTLHELQGEDSFKRYDVVTQLACDNEFDISEDFLHSYLVRTWSDMQVYSLTFRQAVIYNHFKDALKEYFVHGEQLPAGKKLIEFSDEFSKATFLSVGSFAGLEENDVIEILPALALKFSHNEVKFIESAYRGGFFKSAKDYMNAFKEIDGKYETRFEL